MRDYGYFGKGASGYAHYMQTFNSTYRKDGGSGGSNGGCLGVVLAVLVAGGIIARPFL